ncbi:hypothetical protein [Burkholderia pseudomallei]|uniref:hypothetical protein n=1 Tax=Burkholderia pseudomallei TaxID=28450 RepID=UPI001F1F4380|nr:hypothetical protein [Burkholderia pseudomallei]
MLEKTIETYLVDRVRAAGGDAYKFSSPARVSVPDRIVIFPPARIYFVELKRPGGKPTRGQVREHERLRALGCDVRVIDSREAVDAFVRQAVGARRADALTDHQRDVEECRDALQGVGMVLDAITEPGLPLSWLRTARASSPNAAGADERAAFSISPLQLRWIKDNVRDAYDTGYNDARRNGAVSGDSAPGYRGRDIEKSKGAELAAILERTTRAPRTDVAGGVPIDMLLFCPKCGVQHVDGPEVGDIDTGNGVRDDVQWTNPPHRSHLCHACGTVWRPADVPTNGVASIETQGKDDTWTSADAAAAPADGDAA